VLLVACAITIIGILMIPIAALAWALAYAGAFTLGILAVALVIGRALAGRGAGSSDRSAAVRGLTVGLLTLSLIWFGAAIAAKVPVAGAIARLIAVAQLSMRFGGSRFGMTGFSSRWGAASTTTTTEVAAPGWQTPTPVQGVVAARRPVSTDNGTGNGAEL
jgi:hypothetical protein